MKTKAILIAALTTLSACDSGSNPVQIIAFTSIPEDCSLEAGADVASQGGGSLDIAATTAYFIDMRVRSTLQEQPTTVGGDELAGTGRSDFLVSEVVLTYRSEPSSSFETDRYPLFFNVPPSGGEASVVRLNLIGPKAGSRLATFIPTTADGQPLQTTQLLVTVQLKGKLQSGAAVETNEATFPITVFRTAFTGCPDGTTLAGTGPCGAPGGQDGSRPACL